MSNPPSLNCIKCQTSDKWIILFFSQSVRLIANPGAVWKYRSKCKEARVPETAVTISAMQWISEPRIHLSTSKLVHFKSCFFPLYNYACRSWHLIWWGKCYIRSSCSLFVLGKKQDTWKGHSSLVSELAAWKSFCSQRLLLCFTESLPHFPVIQKAQHQHSRESPGNSFNNVVTSRTTHSSTKTGQGEN